MSELIKSKGSSQIKSDSEKNKFKILGSNIESLISKIKEISNNENVEKGNFKIPNQELNEDILNDYNSIQSIKDVDEYLTSSLIITKKYFAEVFDQLENSNIMLSNTFDK